MVVSSVLGDAPDDPMLRADNADFTVGSPLAWTKPLSAPNTVTAELLANKAHDPNTAAAASAYRADRDMAGNDHTVWIRLATAVWNTVNDNVGVIARSGTGALPAFYQFSVVRIAGPAYVPYLFRFGGGALIAVLPGSPGANLAAAPAVGDLLGITVAGSTITGKIITAAGSAITAVSNTDTNIAAGTRGGFYLQRGDATANFAIDGIWLNTTP
jgi:hypothetical protein